MKINYESDSSRNMYQVGNTIWGNDGDDLYLIADNAEGELFVVNLSANLVYGAYKTMDDLYHDVGSKDDILVHAEINVF